MKHCETTLNLQQIWHRKKKCEKKHIKKTLKNVYTSIQALSLADPDRVTGLVVCGLLSLPCLDNIGRPKHTESQSHHVMWTIGAAALMCSIPPHLSLTRSKKYPLVMPEVEMLKSSSLLQAMLAAALCVTCSDPALAWTNHRPFSTS